MARAVVIGSDRDRGVIDAAIRNADRAGVLDLIHPERCAIGSNRWLNEPDLLATKDFVLVATNPPYNIQEDIGGWRGTTTTTTATTYH